MKSKKQISYIISVSIGKGCYRHLRVSGNATLADLADSILDAFDFCNDHLYSFFMDDRWWSDGDCYHSPYDSEEPCATSAALCRLGLTKGSSFKFLFDYGDEWRFQCKVLQVIEEPTDKTVTVRSKGKAPEQYPEYYDEDDYDSDDDDESFERNIIMKTLHEHDLYDDEDEDDDEEYPVPEIPDKMYEEAFRFRTDKLWKKLDDSHYFAVKLSDGEIGYCNIIGMINECIALILYIGDVGLWSLRKITEISIDDNTDAAALKILLTQNCLQLSLDNKSDLPEMIAAPAAEYAKAHGINLRGKNSYPNFMKYETYRLPDLIYSEKEYDHLAEAARAAHDISEKLKSSSVKELFHDEDQDMIPLLTPDGEGFKWTEIKFPEPKTFPYPIPHISREHIEKLNTLTKKGTLEGCVYFSENPEFDENIQKMVLSSVLITAGTPNKVTGSEEINCFYPDSVDDIMERLISKMIGCGTVPKTIVTIKGNSAAFFSDLCEKCGIELKTAEKLPKVDKVLSKYKSIKQEEFKEDFDFDSLITLLETLDADQLRTMPEQLKELLRPLYNMGILSPELEKKL